MEGAKTFGIGYGHYMAPKVIMGLKLISGVQVLFFIYCYVSLLSWKVPIIRYVLDFSKDRPLAQRFLDPDSTFGNLMDHNLYSHVFS